MRKYEIELRKLKLELQEKESLLQPNVKALEAERKRAEEDKRRAIHALEITSKEFKEAQLEKTRLEEKIKQMDSQMLVGGRKIEDLP